MHAHLFIYLRVIMKLLNRYESNAKMVYRKDYSERENNLKLELRSIEKLLSATRLAKTQFFHELGQKF